MMVVLKKVLTKVVMLLVVVWATVWQIETPGSYVLLIDDDDHDDNDNVLQIPTCYIPIKFPPTILTSSPAEDWIKKETEGEGWLKSEMILRRRVLWPSNYTQANVYTDEETKVSSQ